MYRRQIPDCAPMEQLFYPRFVCHFPVCPSHLGGRHGCVIFCHGFMSFVFCVQFSAGSKLLVNSVKLRVLYCLILVFEQVQHTQFHPPIRKRFGFFQFTSVEAFFKFGRRDTKFPLKFSQPFRYGPSLAGTFFFMILIIEQV
jgi:hypothetical protein